MYFADLRDPAQHDLKQQTTTVLHATVMATTRTIIRISIAGLRQGRPAEERERKVDSKIGHLLLIQPISLQQGGATWDKGSKFCN